METQLPTFDSAVAKEPGVVIRELALLRTRSEKGEKLPQPKVTLWLKNGREISGWVLACGNGAEHPILFNPMGPQGEPSQSALYLNLPSIEAITVHDTLSLKEAVEPDPTLMELKRRLQYAVDSFESKTGISLNIDAGWGEFPENSYRRIALFLKGLGTLLGNLSQPPAQPRRELEGLRTLVIRAGTAFHVHREGARLVFQVPVDISLTASQIRSAFESSARPS